MRAAKGNNPQLSPGEREIFVKARKLLSGEIALALGVKEEVAEDWIEEQLARPE
jgi:RNA polymerase-interacting CarD/CdnL/TRCF family regulator